MNCVYSLHVRAPAHCDTPSCSLIKIIWINKYLCEVIHWYISSHTSILSSRSVCLRCGFAITKILIANSLCRTTSNRITILFVVPAFRHSSGKCGMLSTPNRMHAAKQMRFYCAQTILMQKKVNRLWMFHWFSLQFVDLSHTECIAPNSETNKICI